MNKYNFYYGTLLLDKLDRSYSVGWLVGWLYIVLRIYVALAVFQPYCDLEAGDNQSLKIQVAIEAGNRTAVLLFRKPRAYNNHSATAEVDNTCIYD